jgi:hypothetical protein
MALAAKARERLIRFVAIAATSNADGEALAALRQAVKLASASGLDLPTALAEAGRAAIDVARLAQLEQDAFRRGVASATRPLQDEYDRGFKAGAAQATGPAPPPPPQPPPSAPSGPQVSWKAAAQAVLVHYPACIRGPKESDFIDGLLKKGWAKLTEKQADWLRDICARAGLSW